MREGEKDMAIFEGCATAIATPMFADGTVDFDAYTQLIEFNLAGGVDAIIAAGTTGEASTLDNEEHIAVVEHCVKVVNGRVPVIGGAGSNDTRHGVDLAKRIEAVGADALLLVTPYYNKCSQRGLVEHFKATTRELSIPSILYSVPSRTGVNILPATAAELAQETNIVAIKEATGDISQVAEMCRVVPEDFAVYSGNDDMVVPLMSLGGKGVISVTANVIPADITAMTHYALEGDYANAARIQLATKPLTDALFADVNPIPVKAALAMMGKMEMTYRLPLCAPSEAVQARLRTEMEAYGLL